MKLYADTPLRRSRQLLADIATVAWVLFWVWLGKLVHDTFLLLRTPADSIANAGTKVSDAFAGAGDSLSRIPGIGDNLQGWLEKASDSGGSLHDAGSGMGDTIATIAGLLGFVTALTPIALVAIAWFVYRWGFIREASSSQRFIDSSADLDLFALRAMATQPMAALNRISLNPVAEWRAGNTEVITALAALELRDQGLRPPATPPATPVEKTLKPH